jgi:hypothetical protein
MESNEPVEHLIVDSSVLIRKAQLRVLVPCAVLGFDAVRIRTHLMYLILGFKITKINLKIPQRLAIFKNHLNSHADYKLKLKFSEILGYLKSVYFLAHLVQLRHLFQHSKIVQRTSQRMFILLMA